jgi:hypothetical protein
MGMRLLAATLGVIVALQGLWYVLRFFGASLPR